MSLKHFCLGILALTVLWGCVKDPVTKPPTQNVIKSSCNGNAFTTDYFKEDAGILAVKYANKLNDGAISISQTYYDEILAALLAVYNSTDLPERDSVVTLYPIHAKNSESIHQLLMNLDGTLSWVDEWRMGNKITNQPDIDQLVSDYDLEIQVLDDTPNNITVLITSILPINILNLANNFKQINGVSSAAVKEAEFDGNDIQYYKDNIFRELIFSVGYGDCQNSCEFRRYWRFLIYIDCSVEFLESYGDPAP